MTKRMISPKADPVKEVAPGREIKLLTCRVYADADGKDQIIVSASGPALRSHVIEIARIAHVGTWDEQRILACDIAYAMNLRRGYEDA